MATDLTAIFGTEIKVYAQPVVAVRQYTAFPGGHGLISMHLGTRGSTVTVTGKIATGGANYAAARASCQAAIDAIETYQLSGPADYSFYGITYARCVFERFELIPDNGGKVFHYTAEGYVTADFVALFRMLI